MNSKKLFVDSELFCIPRAQSASGVSADKANDQAYIIIDSARAGVSYFFKIEKLGGKPEVAAVETDFERPSNIEKSYK